MKRSKLSRRLECQLVVILYNLLLLAMVGLCSGFEIRFLRSKFASRWAIDGIQRRPCSRSPQLLMSTSHQQWINAGNKGMTLVIVESPAKAKTIQEFLNKDKYIVDWCAGHVRDLSKAKDAPPELRKVIIQKELALNAASLGVNVHNEFEPVYVNMESKADIIKRLRGTAEMCSRILLASDEDREGEAISWHLAEVLQPNVPFKRAVFSEITKDAIERSFKTPRDINMDLGMFVSTFMHMSYL